MAGLLISPELQVLDNNADPLASGKVYCYQAGTSILKDTYTTQAGTTANSNPVILDSSGRGSIWLDSDASYRIVIKDSDGNLISETNSVRGVGDITAPVIVAYADVDTNGFSIVTTANQDIKMVPDGTGVLSVEGTTGYEAAVTSDDIIPNKGYTDTAIPPIASAAEVLAATNTTKTVSPGRVKDSPYVFDTFCSFNALPGGSGDAVILNSSNISSITREEDGLAYIVTLYFEEPMSDTYYPIMASHDRNDDGVFYIYERTTTYIKLHSFSWGIEPHHIAIIGN